MRSQIHNQGELLELKVSVEKDTVEAFYRMAANSGYTLEDLVVIALKRFRSSHADFEGNVYQAE